jgi:glutamate-1-semialdehyde 2,1-aminomutase
LTAPFNDLEALERVVEQHGSELAAIILEPVAGNMGCVPPLPGYLAALRSACDRVGALLIFDEVMTGFRLAPGGAQELYGIEADLVTYGKVIGGGMPIGAFGGRGDVMDHIAPTGKVYQAGTLSGNPVAVAAGYATLKVLRDRPDIYGQVAEATRILHDEMLGIFTKKGIPVAINRVGSMISVHFGREKVQRFDDAGSCDLEQFNRFFHHMLEGGVYLPPSAFETWFISASIGGDELDKTLEVVGNFEG